MSAGEDQKPADTSFALPAQVRDQVPAAAEVPLGWRARAKHRVKIWMGVRVGVLWHHAPRPLRLPVRYYRPVELSDPPSISIVTPSYEQGPFLEGTLRSVLDQRYPRLEYVVQDGGSTDESTAVLERYRARLTHAESRRDRGQAHAINLGFARTSGEIMAYLNSDDQFLPGTLAYVADFFQRHPEVDVVYGHRIIIDEQGAEVGRWVLPPHDDQVLHWVDFVPQETLFWRRNIWDRTGGAIDESFQFAMDWDLVLRFHAAGARMVRLPRFLGAFRVHGLSKTMTQVTQRGAREIDWLRARVLGRCVSRAEIGQAIRGYLVRQALCHRLYQVGLLHY
jgi:carbamoyltransferase